MNDKSQLNTYFVRHTERDDFDADMRDALFENHLIGVHYDNVASINPKDYGSRHGQAGMAAINTLGEHGGFVCASYWGIAGCIVSRVIPGTPVKPKDYKCDGKSVLVKTLSVVKPRPIKGPSALRVLVAAPPFTAICRWAKVQNRIATLHATGSLSISSVDHLVPGEQEIMCAEYLRRGFSAKHRLPTLSFLTYAVGGNQRSVDFTGVDHDGVPVLAQVTYRAKKERAFAAKEEALRRAGDGVKAHLLMFCRETELILEGAVKYVPLELVFQEMRMQPDWANALGIQSHQ